jgi:hypothetical protein
MSDQITTSPSGWISVEDRLPLGHALATYINQCGRRETVIAFHAKKHEIKSDGDDEWFDYDEGKDCFYLKEGWYENLEDWDGRSSITINCAVTHWMPLPAPPQEKS